MSKPIIAIYAMTKEWQVEEIRNTASGYLIKTREEMQPEDFEHIEIVYGWNSQLTTDSSQLNRLRWIQKETAGLDAIPAEIRNSQSILVSNMSGVHAIPITENVFGYILSMARGIIPAIKHQLNNHWEPKVMTKMFSLKDKSILVYGTGAIGVELARTAKFFGMKTYGVNSNGRSIEHYDATYNLEGSKVILPEVDFVVNALPLTEQSKYFFNQAFFNKMKESAFFINIGRGESVKDKDLIDALESGTISGAYLDVTSPEPLPTESALWQTENLVITPHIAGRVEHFRNEIYPIFKENLDSYLKNGTLSRNEYNKKKGY